MTFLDLLSAFPIAIPGPPAPEQSRRGEVLGFVCFGVFPVVGFAIVLFAGVWTDFTLALFGLPICFATISALICMRLRLETAVTLRVILGCLAMCFVASGVGVLLGILVGFYSDF